MTVKEGPIQCFNNDFDYAKKIGPGFFINLTEAERTYLSVAGVSHKNVDIPMEQKRVIANLINLKLIKIA